MAYRSVKQLIRRAEVITLPGSATVREASRLMAEHHIGAVLIVADGELEGIFTERDALNKVLAQEKDPDATPVSGVMTGNPLTITPGTTAIDALRLMTEVGFRHLPVVEEGTVYGMISLRDFIGAEFQMAGDS